jgi:AmmeMemoRadiSam system protein B
MLAMTGWSAQESEAAEPPPAEPPRIRAQVDTVGYATSWQDMEALVAAARLVEGDAASDRRWESGPRSTDDRRPAAGWVAAIMPHDDYLYAARTNVHLLSGLQARHWLLVGVCHACRRLGVRDRLIFDSYESWQVAGKTFSVDKQLRSQLLDGLSDDVAYVDDERQAAEHSVESLLPWLGVAVPGFTFVSVLVPTMEWPRLQELADLLSTALAEACQTRGWVPGRDFGILISADAVHYGCEGWGNGGYAPFGCDAEGRAAAVAQDLTLAQATLVGPLNDDGLARFIRLVWDPSHPDYPTYPYRITWCGLYSIPFGLAVAHRLQAYLNLPPLTGTLLRYGDSVGDGRLYVPETGLGVTAPNTLQHWVGYPALGYVVME